MLCNERYYGLTVKRKKDAKTSIAAKIAAGACASLVLVGCIGFGVASASGSAKAEDTTTFGLAATSSPASTSSMSLDADDSFAHESTVLTSTAQRDISKGIQAIEAKEEAERIAAEEAARREEAERIAAAEAAKAAQQADSAAAVLAGLSDVDWSIGKDAFIEEWTARIDAYLAGSPLSGQGHAFATAAWTYNVDPRWSPAISNTESTKGSHCFLPYNAWGWGQRSFSGWEEAIDAHVAGLANGYGHSITYWAAAKYCPPNTNNWFHNTVNQMMTI